MHKINIDTDLANILQTHSPSGQEYDYSSILGNVGSVVKDSIGNCICSINTSKNFRLLIEAHADEISLRVIYISDDGYIFFRQNGGVDPLQLIGQSVTILSDSGEITGVVGCKPMHIKRAEEYAKVPLIEDLFIDIGVCNGSSAKQLVKVGDYVVFSNNLKILNNNRISSKGIDNKVGVYILSRILKQINKDDLDICVYGVLSSQEEIGCRGANVAVQNIKPQMIMCIDTCVATDTPDISSNILGDIRLGRGVAIPLSTENSVRLIKEVEIIAKNGNIKYQTFLPHSVLGRNNTPTLQINGGGCEVLTLCIPCRYLHSSVEICDISDINAAISLAVRFIESLRV